MPVKFSVRGRDLGSAVAEAQARIARNVQLPQGYRLEWAGEFQELQTARARLMIVVPIAIAVHPGAAVWTVQLVARQSADARRHSVCDRRWHGRALFSRDRT